MAHRCGSRSGKVGLQGRWNFGCLSSPRIPALERPGKSPRNEPYGGDDGTAKSGPTQRGHQRPVRHRPARRARAPELVAIVVDQPAAPIAQRPLFSEDPGRRAAAVPDRVNHRVSNAVNFPRGRRQKCRYAHDMHYDLVSACRRADTETASMVYSWRPGRAPRGAGLVRGAGARLVCDVHRIGVPSPGSAAHDVTA